MELHFSQSFGTEYRKVTKGNNVLKKRIAKQIIFLETNINHPSLRLHKLSNNDYWSVSIDKSIRMLITVENELIIIYHIGKHEDVY